MSETVDLGAWLRAKAAEAARRPLPGQPGGDRAEPVHEHRIGTATPAPPSAAPRNPAFPNLRAPWRRGETGNPRGRPTASRDRLGEAFIRDLTADFGEHGRDAIRRAREADPLGYLALVARLVPKDLRAADGAAAGSILERFDAAELVALRRQLEEALALARAGHPLVLPPILAEEAADDGAGQAGDS
jgi:hypothetical protein